MTDPFVIETADLRKRYDGVEALRGLSLGVPAGSICGFLGRNGAGKTTTLKILLGMARPTAGSARVFGLPADQPDPSLEIRRGAFLLCPCHLPLTLGLAATLLGGTALGVALRGHPILAGTVITLAWVAATWRGFHLLRRAGLLR